MLVFSHNSTHNSSCCFHPWSCFGTEKWCCREAGAETIRIYGRGDNSQHFPSGSQGGACFGKSQMPSEEVSSPSVASDSVQVILFPSCLTRLELHPSKQRCLHVSVSSSHSKESLGTAEIWNKRHISNPGEETKEYKHFRWVFTHTGSSAAPSKGAEPPTEVRPKSC